VFLNCGIGATESSLRRLNRATRHRELYVGSGTPLLSVIEITLLLELFLLAVFHSTVILSRTFSGEGPMELAGSSGAARAFRGPSRQRTPLRMTP
jgi:hypothetical protein